MKRIDYRSLAQTFIPIPEKYKDIPIKELEVHHIDFNHDNNKLENLMWVSKKDHIEIHRKSEITKKRKSEGHKGKRFTEEHRNKISEKLKGRVFSEEHINHLREANKGEKNHKKINHMFCSCNLLFIE